MTSRKDALAQASENIRVAVRCRPLSNSERERGGHDCTSMDVASNSVEVESGPGQTDRFTFDYVFNNQFTQKDIFIQVIQPMLDAVLEGFNATIFAYGQSGSGKTFTMNGVLNDPELKGMIPRSFEYIFGHVRKFHENPASGRQYKVYCQYLELYNGNCRDLLNPKAGVLPVKENKDKVFFVKDLTPVEVESEQDLLKYMESGVEHRHVTSTNLNSESSRSHSMFTVILEGTVSSDDAPTRHVQSKLNLVDLAGSERQSKTGAEGSTLKEGCNINLSLSALGTVIECLVKCKPHIPFRSSPLTMLLKDSLGGGSKTTMFANINPFHINAAETVSTLRFADRAKQIKNKPRLQMDPKDAKIQELQDLVDELRKNLAAYTGGDGDPMQNFKDRIAELEAQLETGAGGDGSGATDADLQRVEDEWKGKVATAEEELRLAKEELDAARKRADQADEHSTVITAAQGEMKEQLHQWGAMVTSHVRKLEAEGAAEGLHEWPADADENYTLPFGDAKLVLKKVAERGGGVSGIVLQEKITEAEMKLREQLAEKHKTTLQQRDDEIKELMAERAEANEQMRKAGERIVDLQKKKKTREEEKKAAVTELGEVKAKVSELTTLAERVPVLEGEVEALKETRAQMEKEIEGLRSAAREVGVTVAEGGSLQDEVKKVLQRGDELEREMRHANDVRLEAERELKAAKTALQRQQNEREVADVEHEKALTRAKSEVSELQASVDKLREEVDGQREVAARSASEISRLEKALERLQSEKSEVDEELRGLQANVAGLATAELELKKLRASNAEFEDEVRELNRQVERSRATYERQEKVLEQRAEEITTLTAELRESKLRYEALVRVSKETLKKELDASVAQMNATIQRHDTEHTKALSRKDDEIAAVTKKLAMVQSALDEVQTKYDMELVQSAELAGELERRKEMDMASAKHGAASRAAADRDLLSRAPQVELSNRAKQLAAGVTGNPSSYEMRSAVPGMRGGPPNARSPATSGGPSPFAPVGPPGMRTGRFGPPGGARSGEIALDDVDDSDTGVPDEGMNYRSAQQMKGGWRK